MVSPLLRLLLPFLLLIDVGRAQQRRRGPTYEEPLFNRQRATLEAEPHTSLRHSHLDFQGIAESLQRDGYVVVKDILPADMLPLVRASLWRSVAQLTSDPPLANQAIRLAQRRRRRRRRQEQEQEQLERGDDASATRSTNTTTTTTTTTTLLTPGAEVVERYRGLAGHRKAPRPRPGGAARENATGGSLEEWRRLGAISNLFGIVWPLAHSEWAWRVRGLPRLRRVFADAIFNGTRDLVSSFEAGAVLPPPSLERASGFRLAEGWLHVDQHPIGRPGFQVTPLASKNSSSSSFSFAATAAAAVFAAVACPPRISPLTAHPRCTIWLSFA